MSTTRLDTEALYYAVDQQRRKRVISWKQVADEIGVSPSVLGNIGYGRSGPNASTALAMAIWLDRSLNEFAITTEKESK